ncbi:MAG: hypothetical protein F4Y45_10335 [Acidobacteria bacterium]|nr:hypothetical protein [Acidobacteriota bacterium]MYJ02834.1 hypothetical protein [Acidobacteriota bacterium]
MTSTERRASVYVPWRTFENAIKQLADEMPSRVDRTVFPSMSGGLQNQLLAGFRFLRLIDDHDEPTEQLKKLAVSDESKRRQVLKDILEERYSELFALDLKRATPAQLGEEMAKSYDVTGSTKERAERFFLAAAEYAGIEVSSRLGKSKRKRNGNATAPKPRAAGARRQSKHGGKRQASGATESIRVVELRSGGTIKIVTSLNILTLEAADRNFVGELISKLDEYETGNQLADGHGEESAGG